MNHSEMEKKQQETGKSLATFTIKSAARLSVAVFYSIIMVHPVWATQEPGHESEENSDIDSTEVEYNSSFIHGAGIDVSRYVKGNPVTPGTHSVYVIVNGENYGRHDVPFTAVAGEVSAKPVFTLKELYSYGIQLYGPDKKQPTVTSANSTGQRTTLDSLIPDSKVSYNEGEFELNLDVPQVNLVKHPRGYIDPARFDSGVTAGFIDYNANMYRYSSDDEQENFSTNLGMMLGMNLGDWRLRKRMNTSWDQQSGSGTQNLYTYAQTDITPLKSQLTLGDSVTSGDLFDSFNLRGAQLQSDDRMLPEGLRNYVPVLRGVAETNAKVTVMQHGQKVYETIVPPGEFELNDIGAMGYGGDLQLIVTEADGRQRIQSVPFSAPPMLLHEGVTRINASVGELNDDSIQGSPKIIQSVLQYGLKNNYTLYGGGQAGEHYLAIAIGNAINTMIGGFSLDLTHAKSELRNNKDSSGNSFNIGYTKYVQQTSTNMTLAAYRYSSRGYYSFRDASITRYGSKGEEGADYRTKQRLTASASQSLWNNSSLSLSASLYNYWDDRKPTKQYSISYNNSNRYFSYSLMVMRTDSGQGEHDNSVTLSVNIPIGSSYTQKPLFSSLYGSVSHDTNNNNFMMNANGSQGEQNELNYGIGSSLSGESAGSTQEFINGNMNYRSRYGQFGVTASANNLSARQISLAASGSVVAHSGGLTLGPELGDNPFAIVDAQGADGAKVLNGFGAYIDGNGYAISPSLSPYRENSVAIDSKGLPDTVDILDGEQIVVPRAGSAIAVKMQTLVGKPMVIVVRDQNNELLPIGTELVDETGESQSIIGQGGMAFIRGWDPEHRSMFAKFSENLRCRIIPDPLDTSSSSDVGNSVVQRKMICRR